MPVVSKINKDLQDERDKVKFNVEEFTNWYYDGAENVAEKRSLEKYFLSDPELNLSLDTSYLGYKEKYEEAIRRSVVAHKKLIKLLLDTNGGYDEFMKIMKNFQRIIYSINPEGDPLMLHFSMFAFTMLNLTSDEQKNEWLPRIINCNILGTYAQTELGHGTYLRALETVATYDKKTKEFILNSPTPTAIKWWPGNLGQTANYAVLMAQLEIDQKNYGIQPFIVQLRDEETHKPLQGITLGDIGNKFGFDTVNNGYMGLKNVRIPRKNMLMKNAKVLEDGTFVKPPSSKLNYGTMMFVRVGLVELTSRILSKACTVAVRYSCVRRQSPINPEEREPKIIDHFTQQSKIFPALTKSIVYKIVSSNLINLREKISQETDEGNLERFPELHAVICCIKAVCTFETRNAIEICRLSCGGHGYLYSSGFPEMYKFASICMTGEGENTVMLLQTARFLMKAFEKAKGGESLTIGVAYLRDFLSLNDKRILFDDSIGGILRAVKIAAAGKIATAWQQIQEKQKNMSLEEATNQAGIQLIRASELHAHVFLLETAINELEKAIRKSSPSLAEVFKNILELYAVDLVLSLIGDVMQFVDISSNDIEKLQKRFDNSLNFFRTAAIGIVDGFDFSDEILMSTLGSNDGNVYERLIGAAKNSPLNQEDVNESFHLYLKPLMKSNL